MSSGKSSVSQNFPCTSSICINLSCAVHSTLHGMAFIYALDFSQLLHLKHPPISLPSPPLSSSHRVILLHWHQQEGSSKLWHRNRYVCLARCGKKGTESGFYCQTKHRRILIFLLIYNQRVASSLFLLFRCFQKIGYQFLAEILAGL